MLKRNRMKDLLIDGILYGLMILILLSPIIILWPWMVYMRGLP